MFYVDTRKFLKAIRGNGYRLVPKGGTFPIETIMLVVRSSGLWEASTRTCPKCEKKITTACWCRSMIACQVSWFSGVVWIYRKLKTKFLNLYGRGMTPRCLNFIPISCMEPRNLPEDTHVIFQPTLVHWNMCLYFKFELCTQRWHVPSQNHEPSWEKLWFARSLYQNLFLFGHFFTTAWYYHDMTPCQVSWF